MFKATEIGTKKGKYERYILKLYLKEFHGSGIARKSISLPQQNGWETSVSVYQHH
jgi:hypothetical protein